MSEAEKPLIYFVDDETELLDLFQMAVEGEFRSMAFSDPVEFLSKYENNELPEPQLLVSDLMMPKLDGLKMIIELRNCTDISCPIILLSGHLSKENLIVAVDNGVEKVLEKPCDLESLRVAIREILYKTEILHIRADVRNTARKIVELSAALEQIADTDLPDLKDLLDRNFLSEDFDPNHSDSTFREELQRLQTRLNNLIEQERVLERLQKVS